MPDQPAKKPVNKSGLLITKNSERALSPAQIEFNRMMKRLENARSKLSREEARLDDYLAMTIRDIMPFIDDIHRINRDIVFLTVNAVKEIKFNKKRRRLLKDLIIERAVDLLHDSCGLDDDDLIKLEKIIEELEPPYEKNRAEKEMARDFEYMRGMLEHAARDLGIDLDVSDLTPDMDPAELESEMSERLRVAVNNAGAKPAKAPRKQTKAQLEKARKLEEQEEARKRDFKSLYKQLAKALHPDLEADPQLKQHKESWMKRLTAAYAAVDLRELLQIEMEWLGEEASNLATAGEEKLKVYCSVLKEQIADVKHQIAWLIDQPQYGLLHRFVNPVVGTLPHPDRIILGLQKSLNHLLSLKKTLQSGGDEVRGMLEQWADDRQRAESNPDCPF
jgi:hypothetical protein